MRRMIALLLALVMTTLVVLPAMAAPADEKLSPELRKMAEDNNWTYVGTEVRHGTLVYHFRDKSGDHFVSQGWLDAEKHEKTDGKPSNGDITLRGTPHTTAHKMFLAAWTIYSTFCTFRQLCTDITWLINEFELWSGTMREPDENGTIVCDIINGLANWR